MNPRLYVGNLSPGITEADLRLLFSRIGGVTDIELKLDPATQESRGYAFVTMASPEVASAALRELHSYNLGGRHITVTEARPPQEAKGLMSEGFEIGSATVFKPSDQGRKSRRGPRGRSRRRDRRH